MKTLNKTPMWTLAIVFAIFTASVFADTRYLTDNVNVRPSPDTTQAPLGKMLLGESIEATDIVENGFRMVKYNGANAYIKDSYLTTEKPPEYTTGCVASLQPNSAANKNSEKRKKIISSMVQYLGVSAVTDVIGHIWNSTDGNGTAFKLADDGELVMSVIDLPRRDWNRLLQNAKDSMGLLGGLVNMETVQSKVRAGQFTGQICLEKVGAGYVITARLDGTINDKPYNGNALTLKPAGGGKMEVRGVFAGENINGTFSAR